MEKVAWKLLKLKCQVKEFQTICGKPFVVSVFVFFGIGLILHLSCFNYILFIFLWVFPPSQLVFVLFF